MQEDYCNEQVYASCSEIVVLCCITSIIACMLQSSGCLAFKLLIVD